MAPDPLESLRSALADRYTVVREIGRGGMASVYLAQDLKHPRQVALKVLRPEVAGALGADRFLKEIELVSRLQHPHILGLLESGTAAGLLYYVMPFVDPNLDNLRKDPRFVALMGDLKAQWERWAAL